MRKQSAKLKVAPRCNCRKVTLNRVGERLRMSFAVSCAHGAYAARDSDSSEFKMAPTVAFEKCASIHSRIAGSVGKACGADARACMNRCRSAKCSLLQCKADRATAIKARAAGGRYISARPV